MKKLQIYGDSVMKGVMFDGEKYSVYKGDLIGRLSEQGIETKKVCKMGLTLKNALPVIEKFGSATSEKCIDGESAVLLEFGGNDSTYNWEEVSENPDGDVMPATTLEDFTNAYKSLVQKFQNMGMKVYIATLVPIDAQKYFDFISKNLSKENIMKFLGDVSMLYRWHELYNEAVRQIAQATQCKIIDLRSGFLSAHNFKNLLGEDGIHPTQEGHALIENIICQAFEENGATA